MKNFIILVNLNLLGNKIMYELSLKEMENNLQMALFFGRI
jgi:hypothetical protein